MSARSGSGPEAGVGEGAAATDLTFQAILRR